MSRAHLPIQVRIFYGARDTVGELISRHRDEQASQRGWTTALRMFTATDNVRLRIVDTHDGSTIKEWP